MKKFSFNEWCKTMWLKFSLLISALMIILILVNWNTWTSSLKCMAAIAALIPIHATEEWIFPGGFAYQYNLFLNKSNYPHSYPMNRASDMFTVLGTTMLYTLIVLYFSISNHTVPNGVLLGATCFSALEVCAHSYFGVRAYLKFQKQGKTTIYGPGSMTAYSGFLVLGYIMIQQMILQGFSLLDIIWCIAILGVTAILVFIPEVKLKDKNSLYSYPNSGYYDRFLNQ